MFSLFISVGSNPQSMKHQAQIPEDEDQCYYVFFMNAVAPAFVGGITTKKITTHFGGSGSAEAAEAALKSTTSTSLVFIH